MATAAIAKLNRMCLTKTERQAFKTKSSLGDFSKACIRNTNTMILYTAWSQPLWSPSKKVQVVLVPSCHPAQQPLENEPAGIYGGLALLR